MSDTVLPKIKEQLKEAYNTKLFFTDLNGRLKNLSVNPNEIENIMIEDKIWYNLGCTLP